MMILLFYTSAFSEVIYADFYAKILDWNFRLVDENSQILVVVFVTKLNFSLLFVSSTKTTEFSSSSSSLWRKLIYCRQRKFSFSSSSTKKTLIPKSILLICQSCILYIWGPNKMCSRVALFCVGFLSGFRQWRRHAGSWHDQAEVSRRTTDVSAASCCSSNTGTLTPCHTWAPVNMFRWHEMVAVCYDNIFVFMVN